MIPEGGPSYNWKGSTLSQIAETQPKAGDISGAFRSARQIQDAYYKKRAIIAIVAGQANAGDIAGAFKTVDLIQNNRLDIFAPSSDRV